MAIQVLPTYSDPFYAMTVTLDGTAYGFEFRHNQRENCWYFNIALDDGTPLVSGVKVVCNVDFLRRAADVRLPTGLLTAAAAGDDDSPPGLDELGENKRVAIYYFPPADLT